jgi:hypothetical protein
MDPDRRKHTRMILRNLKNSAPLIFGWCVLGAFVVILFRSGWSFTDWLREVFSIIWPLGMLLGLFSLLAAHAYRTQKGPDEAYRFMRISAVAFLAALVMLWITRRHYL